MSTLTKQQQITKVRKLRLADVAIQLTSVVQQSMYEFIVTFFALIVSLGAVYSVAEGNAFLTTWGMFLVISIYMILLVIRILRRLDDSFTNDEIASMLASMSETLERIERNS